MRRYSFLPTLASFALSMFLLPLLLLTLLSVSTTAFVAVPLPWCSATCRHGVTPLLLQPMDRSSSSISSHINVTSTSSGTTTTTNNNNNRYWVSGPSNDTRPDYEHIHGPLGKMVDDALLTLFRTSLAHQVGVDSHRPATDYHGLMDLVRAMNARFSNRTEIHVRSQRTLSNMFPSWLPPAYAVLFSKPFPAFSARMNAWATRMAGTWLMGPCQVNDVELADGTIGKNQGLLVQQCRFLQESQCASVCVNSCKIPTQNFFRDEMQLPLTMTPNYDTFECQFAFGVMPNEISERAAIVTPCLLQCPSRGGLRDWHDNNNDATTTPRSSTSTTTDPAINNDNPQQTQCQLLAESIDSYSTS